MTVSTLARIVERHPRTIQRDIEALRDQFDAPLAYDRERRGYYFTDSSWSFPDVKITEGELIAFFAAERILRRLGATTEACLSREALKKLAALLPDEVVIDVSALADAISFAPDPVLEASPEILRSLASAAVHRRRLHIRYHSQYRSKETERDVDVLLLHNQLGEWYAVCFDHLRLEVRDFHAGRIRGLRQTGKSFDPPVDWDADSYLKRGFGMFRGGAAVTVEVEFDSYQARYARERKFHATEKRKEMRDGRLRVTFETTEAALEQVARWVMGYGEHVEALRPESLRKMISERLTRAAALYRVVKEAKHDE
ncbi:MAG TPA: WYL domain-containing protein [Blastocatellia bacterium]|nr:WYL domain-containing protein [Blastocatellia bacterium]